MTPVYYNGNDYYKKMLELQRRLRQSEEERIRLEERFSLLEHESRSRHETCINRLRMRYIEFLEEQQARDERNHKLLGALDRVDSSLALISAKTDRLGTMRRQYEAASLFKNWYVNRRANGSVAGDSGVASQNNDAHVTGSRQQDRLSINKHNNPFISSVHPNTTTPSVRNLGSANYYPSNQTTDPRYDFRRAASVRQESSQMLPYTSSLSSPIQKSESNIPTNANTKYFVVNRPDNASQSFQQSSRKYRYDYPRFNYNTLESSQSSLRSPNDSPLGYSRGPASRRASLLHRDLSKKVSPVYSGLFKDDILSTPPRSPSRLPKAMDISNQDYGNGDDGYGVGEIVENELERYMSRIPKLYRDYAQSPEEFDQEQNTSGDLLNVTFSDDGLDFSAEDRTRDGRKSPPEFGHVLNHPKPESGKIDRSKLPNVYQNTSSVVESGNSKEAGLKATGEGREIVGTRHEEIQHGNRAFPIASDAQLRQLPSITSLSNPTDICDKSRSQNNEKIAALAKNGISLDVARDATESGTRPSRNNENIARARENSNREIDANSTETRQMGRDARLGGNTENQKANDDAVDAEKSSAYPKNLHGNKHTISNGEEHEAGINFQEYTEDLEPWNPSALEKRVQGSMIMKNESQFESIQREFERETNDKRREGQESEINVSGMDRAADMKEIDKYAAGVDDTRAENFEMSLKNHTDSHEEQTGVIPEVQNKVEVSDQTFEEYNKSDESPIVADQLIDRSSHDQNEPNDPNAQFAGSTGVKETYPNQENVMYSQDQMQYDYPVDERYQEGSNAEQYQQQDYDPQNNEQYEGGPSGGEQYQYQVDDQGQYQGHNVGEQNPEQGYASPESNEQYSADNNEQYVTAGDKQYVTDPNQEYVTDPNQEYATDPNQEYATDPNQQYATEPNPEYVTDPNQQYATDPNQEYVTDPNQQYATDPNQEYATDPNQQYATDPNQEYVTDPNQQYATDPNQEYATDPNQQYATDPNQEYVTDPNQQYVTDANEHYVTDPNGQYVTDPNQQYAADPNQEFLGDAQQYPESGAYVQDGNQGYADNEVYEQNVLTGNEGLITESDHGQGLETSVEPDHSQGYGQEYEPTIETDHSQGYDQGPDKSAAQEPQTDIRDDHSGNELLAGDDLDESTSIGDTNVLKKENVPVKKTKDVIKSLLDSDTESTIERNVSNAESDFDFN